MRERGGGAIVNTASISGLRGDFSFAAYNAAKGAVVNYTRATAIDHAREGIRINAVCPGPVDTPLIAGINQLQGIREAWDEAVPLGRFATADEIAPVVAFLASNDASYIVGAAIAVDGGPLPTPASPTCRAYWGCRLKLETREGDFPHTPRRRLSRRHCVVFQHMLGGRAQHLNEHVIAARGLSDDHGGEESGEEQEIASSSVITRQRVFAIVADAFGAERPVVEREELRLSAPARLGCQSAGKEVGDVGRADPIAATASLVAPLGGPAFDPDTHGSVSRRSSAQCEACSFAASTMTRRA
jgi:hypothetical protein